MKFLERDRSNSNEKKRVEKERNSTKEINIQLINCEEDEGNKETTENGNTTDSEDSDDIFESLEEDEEKVPETSRRSTKIKKPVARPDYVTYYVGNEEQETELIMIEEALSGPNSQNWKNAIKSEINSL